MVGIRHVGRRTKKVLAGNRVFERKSGSVPILGLFGADWGGEGAGRGRFVGNGGCGVGFVCERRHLCWNRPLRRGDRGGDMEEDAGTEERMRGKGQWGREEGRERAERARERASERERSMSEAL